jgi:hypothetical protein
VKRAARQRNNKNRDRTIGARNGDMQVSVSSHPPFEMGSREPGDCLQLEKLR